MTGCIYHEADLDGVMSAAIVKKYFKGDIDLLPYNYGKEIPDVNKYDKVFVVDVSFGDRTRFLFDEWEDKGIDVTWIDHHKTVIEAVKDYNVKAKDVSERRLVSLRGNIFSMISKPLMW